MSQSRQVPPHSPSPTKSSLRRTSGLSNHPTNPPTTGRSLLPSPHFEDYPPFPTTSLHNSPRPLEPSYDEQALQEESTQYTQPSQIPPFNFHPFFTLIEDRITNEHHHPTVHYIFADDDAEIITEAACRSLAQNDTLQLQQVQSQSQSESQSSDPTLTLTKTETQTQYEPSRLPPPQQGVKEHYLVLNLAPSLNPPATGVQTSTLTATTLAPSTLEVLSTQSFSPDWQILRTSISNAPTMDEDGLAPGEGLMLRIEGRGGGSPAGAAGETTAATGGVAGGGMDKGKDRDKEDIEEMIERFQKGLQEIRLVMESGGSVGVGGETSGGGAGGGVVMGGDLP